MIDRALEELWRTAPAATQRFDPEGVAHLPPAVRRYLRHTLAPGARLARAARVEMKGTIRVGGAWRAFSAEQVLRWDRGFVWRARTRLMGMPVSGADRFVDGRGELRWKMLGVVPVVTGSGPEIARAAAGRFHAEAIWLPGALLSDDVEWSEHDAEHPHARIRAHGEETALELEIDAEGAIRALSLPRWYGAAEGTPAHYESFGGTCSGELTFEGVTIPATYALGWFFGSDRFETEGEFFRCVLTRVQYR